MNTNRTPILLIIAIIIDLNVCEFYYCQSISILILLKNNERWVRSNLTYDSRALLFIGFLLCVIWGGFSLCGPDVFGWNILLCLVNLGHTISLTAKFLPPRLSVELTDLYLKQFKPLKVGKKHFKELTKEAQILKLQVGDTYAVEDITPADEKLSILLRGKWVPYF